MEESVTDSSLVNALEEIKNLNKDVLKVFIFQGEKILAKEKCVSEAEANKTIKVFESISSQSNSIEGINSITFNGTNGRVDITRINDFYLTIITSKEAGEETVDNLTRVFAPTIFRIIRDVRSQGANNSSEAIKQIEFERKQTFEVSPPPIVKTLELLEQQSFPEQGFAEFTVDDISGLGIISGSSGSVQLDVITAGHWTELYGENKIPTVMIKEANTGETIECKYEVSKNSKHTRKDLVLVPYTIQRKLGIKKGSIVLIKPIIHQESFEEPVENKSANENIVEVIPEQLFRSESHFLPDSASCQLIVKDPSGFDGFRGSNIVRFDKALALRWEELYGEQKIDEVIISDTVFGKTEQFKFKIERDPKFEGKGLIQMPRSLQKALEVKEGSLVIVKPVLK